MSNQTVLITGCSSGFGKLAAKTFQQKGWNVAATMRSPEKAGDLVELENVSVIQLDVTDADSINNAVEKTLATFGRIDALVNNAGYGGHGIFEQLGDEHIKAMFETNVFGTMRTAKAVLPHMRKQGSGVVINVTSMAGILGLPFTTTYSSSKFAVEGWSEGLAAEYTPFNIQVRTVAPGAFGTNFSSATDNAVQEGDEQLVAQAARVGAHFAGLGEQMRNVGGTEADPQDVADLIYRCATEDMPVHNVVGADAEMLMQQKNTLSQEEFLNYIRQMLTPQEAA